MSEKIEMINKRKLTTPELIADLNDWIEEATKHCVQVDDLVTSIKVAAERLHNTDTENAKLREAVRELREGLGTCETELSVASKFSDARSSIRQSIIVKNIRDILARHPEQKDQESSRLVCRRCGRTFINGVGSDQASCDPCLFGVENPQPKDHPHA